MLTMGDKDYCSTPSPCGIVMILSRLYNYQLFLSSLVLEPQTPVHRDQVHPFFYVQA